MGNQPPPWSQPPPRRPAPPRAIDPTTNQPFGRLALSDKIKLKAMNTLLRPFLSKWLPRQLLKVLAGVAATVGATADQAQQTALFVTAAIAWAAEIGLSWLSVRWARRNAAIK
jgi:hypothetical protein